MSVHRVDVVKVQLYPHPNADSLSIVKVFDFTVCVRTEDWKDGDLGAYIQPDSVVDSNLPEFEFLRGHERIRVKKLRGVISQGLLVKAPAGSAEGDDVAEQLNVTHYEPVSKRHPLEGPRIKGVSYDAEPPPPGGFRPIYDVENIRRFNQVFNEGDHVIVTEKIHGMNIRLTYVNNIPYADTDLGEQGTYGRFFVGSKREWKRLDPGSIWWKALQNHLEIANWCMENPGLTLYGEVYNTQDGFNYGLDEGDYRIMIFDCMKDGAYLDVNQWLNYGMSALPLVPLLYAGKYNKELIAQLADGPSTVRGAKHIREGIVIKPPVEMWHPHCGRVQLKLVSDVYLEKAA